MKTNYNALLNLLDEYKSLSLKDLEDSWEIDGGETMRKITGFGTGNCILCKTVKKNCGDCIYFKIYKHGCSREELKESYDAIHNAETPQELMHAIQLRIKDIEKAIKVYKKRKKENYVWDKDFDGKVFLLHGDGDVIPSSRSVNKVYDKYNGKYAKVEDAEYEKGKRRYERRLREATTKAWQRSDKKLNWYNIHQKKYFVQYERDIDVGHCLGGGTRFLPEYYYFPSRKSTRNFIKKNKELTLKFFKVKRKQYKKEWQNG